MIYPEPSWFTFSHYCKGLQIELPVVITRNCRLWWPSGGSVLGSWQYWLYFEWQQGKSQSELSVGERGGSGYYEMIKKFLWDWRLYSATHCLPRYDTTYRSQIHTYLLKFTLQVFGSNPIVTQLQPLWPMYPLFKWVLKNV